MPRKPAPPRLAQGSALAFILIILVAGAAFLVSALKSNPQIERDKITADALAQAKEALIGYAATYRDSYPGNVFGYLPCPAINGNGVAGNCGSKDVTRIGLLPWKTLGLPPLRDSSGECLWYAVSGNFKNSPPTTLLNWDSVGQLIVNDAGGATLASSVAAVIFSPRGVIGSQDRTPAGTTECGGNTMVAAYLDGGDSIYAGTVPAAGAVTTLTLATTASIANAINNDQGLWVSPDEIFRRIKQRNDFKFPALPASPNGDVNNLLSGVAACLSAQTTLPAPVTIDFSTSSMTQTPGVTAGGVVTGRVPPNYVDINCSNFPGNDTWRAAWNGWWWGGGNDTGKNFNDNWQDNLLYAKCNSGQCLNVNGAPCAGVLVFAGERAGGANRATAADKNVVSNYLEGNFLSLFTSGTPTTFTGAPTSFTITDVNTAAAADIAACVNSAASSAGTSGSWNFRDPWSATNPLGDSSGKGMVATMMNGVATQEASPASGLKPNTCMAADTTTGYFVTAPGLDVNTASNGKNSISFWMYWNGGYGDYRFTTPFVWAPSGSYGLFISDYRSDEHPYGAIGFNTGNAEIYGVTANGLANSWHHVAAVFNNGDVTQGKLYIDGVQQTLTAYGSSYSRSATTQAYIGGAGASGNYQWRGKLSNFKLYKGEISNAQVAADMNESGGSCWPYQYPEPVAAGGVSCTTGSYTGTNGADKINVTGNSSCSLDLRGGNNEVLITGAFTGGGSSGSGDDVVLIGGNSPTTIDLGNGNNHMEILGDSLCSLGCGFSVGSGDDTILIGGSVNHTPITLGNGTNRLEIGGYADNSSITGGSGNDTIIIRGYTANITNIDLRGGSDYLSIYGQLSNYGAIQGGSGTDNVYLPYYTTANCAWVIGKMSTDIENIKVSDGMCRGSNFTPP